MKKKSIIIMMTCLLILGGCQSKSTELSASLKKQLEETKAEVTTEAKPTWNEKKELELYNSYINVYNFMVGRFGDSLNRYFKYVDYQEEFTLLDNAKNYYVNEISNYQIEELEKAFTLLEEKEEKEATDEAFLKMYPSLTATIQALNKIYTYTDMKSYLDDDYAKGKEQHATLWTALNEYTASAKIFEDSILTLEREQREQSLMKLKEQGLETLYAVNLMIASAQELQAELYNQELNDGNILDMDMTVIQPLYDNFVSNVETVLELSQNETQLEKEGIPTNSAYWSSFLRNMKDSKVSFTKVLDKVESNTPLSDSDTLITMPGNTSLSAFEAGLSSMINDYNKFIHY